MKQHATSGESAVDAGFVAVKVARVSAARSISWPRAAAIGIGVSLALAVLLLWCPHWMLTRLPMVSRGVRVTLATSWIAGVTIAIIWLTARVAAAPAEDP